MKPKHHKAVHCSRNRNNQCSVVKQSSHHNQHQISIERKVKSLGIISSSSDTDDNEPLKPISKAPHRKNCAKKSWKSQSKSSNLLKMEDEEDVEDDNQVEGEKYDALFQSVRARREQLVGRLRIYNSLFKLNNGIKNDVRLQTQHT